MPDSLQSVAALVDSILTWQGIVVADATATQRAYALAVANDSYREVMRGAWLDEDGGEQQHVWSFLIGTDITTMAFAEDAYNAALPSDYDGMIEAPQYPYSATAAGPGLELSWVSPAELLRRRRDDQTSGTPEVYTIRPKTFAAATGSTYEMAIDPPTDTAVVFVIRYRQLAGLLTDSVDVYLRGPAGVVDLVLFCARKREELWRGQVNGPEAQNYYVALRRFVRHDQELYGDSDVVTSFTQMDSGLSV